MQHITMRKSMCSVIPHNRLPLFVEHGLELNHETLNSAPLNIE